MKTDGALCERCRQAYLQAWNEGRMEALDAFWAPRFVRRLYPYPDIAGLEAYKLYIQELRAAFPDLHVAFRGFQQEKETITFWGTFHGHLSGKLPSECISGDGEEVAFEWRSQMCWKSGKIVAEDFEIDYVAQRWGRPCRE